MLTGWLNDVLVGIVTINQILTAGIAITAFSLFLYSLSFNLRDRVARSFALILLCVVVVFTSEALESAAESPLIIDLFLRLEWVGIAFLPAVYLHLSDGLLITTGQPSKGRRRLAVRLTYFLSAGFLILLASGNLLGELVLDSQPAPHLQRTYWTELFTLYYAVIMVWAWVNFGRAYSRTLTRSGRRRMIYLLAGATAPALGSFPYLLYGSSLASRIPILFWGLATANNLLVGGLMIVMAYAVAFFGVSWPDRVVKSRLFKWIMRGPVTASLALGVMTIVRRVGELFGLVYSAAVPTAMVVTVLLVEHTITLVAPLWERWIFFGRDRTDLMLLQNLEERLVTQGDLTQFLEAVLAALRDHLQSPSAFIAALDDGKLAMIVAAGSPALKDTNLDGALELIQARQENEEFIWGDYWLFPLHEKTQDDEQQPLLGLLGVVRRPDQTLAVEQRQSLGLLEQRAARALQDRRLQQNVFSSLENLKPQADMIQRWRASGRYDNKIGLLEGPLPPEFDLASWVKDALTHYWGGPKLTQSPLMRLNVVQQAFQEHKDSPANALRAILRQAVDSVRPEGERRFTGEWILFNILEMKFIEGRKVREVAARLAMSEADLYRKQRVAIEEVARIIIEMEINGKATFKGRRLGKIMVEKTIISEDGLHHDEGWWASVLADEESHFAPVIQPAKQAKLEEKPRPAVDWEQAMDLYRQDKIIILSATGFNRGGVLVEGNGLFGFVPCSHLIDLPVQVDNGGREECLSGYTGRKLKLKVIECVPEEGRMVFSERAAQAEAGMRPVLLSSLKRGQHVTGKVTNITEFGIFVDLGGVEGLIHISELSWGRVNHPGQVLTLGQQVEVLVLEVAPERCRVALSLKRLCANPWETADHKYPVNQVFPAVVTALVPFGVFARLEEGLEGLIHISEIPLSPNSSIQDILAQGQEVQVRILQVEANRQRLGLSLKVEV